MKTVDIHEGLESTLIILQNQLIDRVILRYPRSKIMGIYLK
ncbi:MAG: hypothetical protein WBF52_20665 [Geitlerinemataceae cyanobacterium]